MCAVCVLGHLARRNDQIPKQLLFGELVKTRPRYGPKKRWRDLAVMDVRTLGRLVHYRTKQTAVVNNLLTVLFV